MSHSAIRAELHKTEKPDPLLLPDEVRARVRLSEPTIYRLRRAGRFPAPLRLGPKRIAWRESEIEAWIAACDRAGTMAEAE